MAKIHLEFETAYDRGDVVIFVRDKEVKVGVIEGFYVDGGADNSIWYNIRTSKDKVYSFSSGGDIAEWDIIGEIEGDLKETLSSYIGYINKN